MSYLEMLVNPGLVHRMKIVCYAVLVFFSFFIFIGIPQMKDKANDICPLYKGKGEGHCDFPLAISIIFQLLFLSFRIATLLLLLLGRLSTEFVIFSDRFELIYLGVDVIGTFFTFIGACILSDGTNKTCKWAEDRHASCDDQEWLSPSKAAQAGAWISTFVWLFISAVGFYYLKKMDKIPFLGSGSASAATGAGGQGPNVEAPPIETPPPYQADDDYSKY